MVEKMTVKDLQEMLKLAKNKDAEIIFKTGNHILKPQLLAEALLDGEKVRSANLGEANNVLVFKMTDIPATPDENKG